MQTAKEFLDEECEAILGTQAEANDYFLSCLNESIVRIQDDFDELNTRQLKQVESDYEQMIKVAEEQTLAKVATVQETSDRQGAAQVECDKLRNENHSATHELSALHDTNRTLTERVLAMVSSYRGCLISPRLGNHLGSGSVCSACRSSARSSEER